jgi:ABC-type transport system substrate-binding protein
VTVRFDLKRPKLDFEATLASPQVPIFAPEAFENQDQFKAQPVGTGPFQVDFHEYQNRTDYVRHPRYWQTPPYRQDKYGDVLPYLDKYTRQYYANPVTAQEAFLNGRIDSYQPGCGLDTTLVKQQLEAVPDALVMTNGYWANSPMGIRFQYQNPLFQDLRVRQALSMSIDRELVWSGGMDRTGLIDASPIPLVYQGLDAPVDLKEYGAAAEYNPVRAKELLIEAGLTPPLRLQIYQTRPQPVAWQGALDTVVFNWKQAGVVDAQLVVRDGQVFQQDMVNRSFPELAFVGGGGLIFGYTLSSSVTPAFHTGSPANYGELSDPTLDDLLERYGVATDPAAAADLARQASKRIVENVDHLWFGEIQGIEVAQPWLHGMVVCEHSCVHFIGGANIKYVWVGADAPDGRGGTPI